MKLRHRRAALPQKFVLIFTLVCFAVPVCQGCMGRPKEGDVWDYSEALENLQTLRSATESAPKKMAAMVAQELKESFSNHSRRASGEAASVLASLSDQTSAFVEATSKEDKAKLLERIKAMEQTIPAPAAG
ncbi:hypothetical protein Pla175_19450 [Pirellulimonas nuda]|uniref:Uncharacterized protein n=1 Tax=Pirellulimonas nuda TaxID=2528009 RepID=A0A518DAQ2_9BACT|nr:hypothetical protein [Pirellulimonas nuda]QDU88567.1 hypothetical protein Pla175_19450 [Pirellulimonas nuda]